MKRSLQEVIELVVFGLIALLLGTGLLWLVGAVFGLVGTVLGWLAGLLWALLRFVVPVALIAGAVVWLIRAARGRSGDGSTAKATQVAAPSATPTVDADPPAAPATQDAPSATDVAAADTPAPAVDDPAPTVDAPAPEVDAPAPAANDEDADPDRRTD